MVELVTDPETSDTLQPFQIEGTNIRGRIARLSGSYQGILGTHLYPEPVAGILGETIALTAAISTSLKFNGILYLQTQSDGPVPMLITDVTSGGQMRGYARYKEDALPTKNKASHSVPDLLGSGHLTFTLDQGTLMDRYQGIVALEGNTIAECAQSYFLQSEQLETSIIIATQPVADEFPPRVAIIMIQKMPGESRLIITADEEDNHWQTANILLNTLTAQELLDPRLSTDRLLYRLFNKIGIRLYEKKEIFYQCRCNQEKVAETLASFSTKELDGMKTEAGKITATCEFCGTVYAFDDARLNIFKGI